MRIDVKAVHLDVTEKIREHLDKKLHRIDYAASMIEDLHVTLTKEKSCFMVEATIHFRWGATAHIGEEAFDLLEGIDILSDKIDVKVAKEKEKIQEHGRKTPE